MTLYDLTRILARRWWILLLVFAVAAAGGWAFHRDGGIYVTRTIVSFEAPDAGPWEEGGSTDRGVILFASAVASDVNRGVRPVTYSQGDAPFYGAGIRQGMRITVPDSGGQWGVVYNKAAVAIDVVSPDRGWVRDHQRDAVAAVLAAAEGRQTGIGAENRIAVDVDPLSETIELVAPSRTAQVLAAAALAGAAALVGGWLASIWDRRLRAGDGRDDGIRGIRRTLRGSRT